jgi:dihydropyrimidinase
VSGAPERYDLVIRGGVVVTAAASRALDVGIVGERIATLAPRGGLAGVPAAEVLDADGLLVLPGGVDPHCHYNLGHNSSGDIRNESQEYSWAAAFGGTTTVIDFAVQDPPMTLHAAVDEKKAEAAGRMAVDYGLHAITAGAVSFETLEEIGDVVRGGIPTIKTFMTYGWMTDDGHRFGLMTEVAKAGGMSLVHAEDDALAGWLRKKHIREGKTHGAYVSEARGSIVEEAAIRRAMLLAERSGSPLYVLHMAAAAGVEALADARARGLPFHGETLIGYLSFTAEHLWDRGEVRAGDRTYPDRGLLWVSFPPVKTADDQRVLWQAAADGRIGAVSSDHSAFDVVTRYEKMGNSLEDELMQGGNSAVELRLPVLYHRGVCEGRLSVERFVELIATSPAKLMGLYPRKGEIAVGSDADIVLLDPKDRWTVRWQDLHTSPEYSCWDGWELQGRVKAVLLRGSSLVRDGEFVGSRGGGQFIPRRLDSRALA